ncbi:MAG: tetratricopeptide repeat protein, partial [bacterium]|nr:tetratricopeptide repeat protein [bacterium]
ALMERFLSRVGENDPYRFLSMGHTYFLQAEFEGALTEYDKARALGVKFWDNDRDYYRYLEAAQATKNYDKAAMLIEAYLANREKDADNYFNLAVAYFKLGEKDKAKEAYLQASALDAKYRGSQYQDIFLQ